MTAPENHDATPGGDDSLLSAALDPNATRASDPAIGDQSMEDQGVPDAEPDEDLAAGPSDGR